MRILKKQSFNMDLEKESLTLGGVKRRCGEFDNFLLVVNLITPSLQHFSSQVICNFISMGGF